MRVCLTPGCTALTDASYCDEHVRAKRRGSARRRRRTPQQQMYAGVGPLGRKWRRTRAQYLRVHPVCEDESGCLAEAVHVHHLDGEPLGPDGFAWSNLQGLCLRHHSVKTAREQPGGWAAWSRE